jgi:hypothetical protein
MKIPSDRISEPSAHAIFVIPMVDCTAAEQALVDAQASHVAEHL